MKKRGTIHGLEEYVASEVIAYLESDTVKELKKVKHSLKALETLTRGRIKNAKEDDQCVACNVWFSDQSEKDLCYKVPCENSVCESRGMTTCGRFDCKPVTCFVCGVPMCFGEDCTVEECHGEYYECRNFACGKCAKTLPSCQGCAQGCGSNIACPAHPVRKYLWKPGQEVTACDGCIEYWDKYHRNIDDREDF